MGLLKHNYKISLAYLMTVNGLSDHQIIKQEVDFLLNILPKGTVFLNATHNHNVVSTYKEYILKFEHPLFEDDSYFETDFCRVAWQKDGQLVQASLFTGITYYNPDGSMKY